MGLNLSRRVLEMQNSPTLAMVTKIAQLKKQGIDIIGFNVGEPDFPAPVHINQALIDAVNAGYTKYTSANGILPLRISIQAKLLRDNKLDYDVNQITIGIGAKQILFSTMMALLNPLDEVIIPTPCWVSYEEMVKVMGGVVKFVKTKDDFSLDLESIENAISPKTKAIIINTPNNPTGAVYSKSSLSKLAELAIKNSFYVISDEIYEKLVYENQEVVSIGSLNNSIFNQTITVNGFAKAFAMTGHRIGYAAGPQAIIDRINIIASQSISNVTTPVQYAGIAALDGDQSCVTEMIQEFNERRKLAISLLKENSNLRFNNVKGAFYFMIDISYYYGSTYNNTLINTSTDLSNYLLEEAHVAIVPGSAFQASNYIRLSYSNSKANITAGILRMNKALNKLKQ